MELKKQQEINVALLKCLMASHKAMMSLTQMMNTGVNERSEKIKIYEQANNLYFAAIDKCLNLLEESENDN